LVFTGETNRIYVKLNVFILPQSETEIKQPPVTQVNMQKNRKNRKLGGQKNSICGRAQYNKILAGVETFLICHLMKKRIKKSDG
jgi:hypothetical protein